MTLYWSWKVSHIKITTSCLTSWTSSGFFLEIICVKWGDESFTNFHVSGSYLKVQLAVRAGFAAKTFLWGCQKHEQGNSSECDNECIIKRVTVVFECKKETSPTFITNRVAGRQRQRNSACKYIRKITAHTVKVNGASVDEFRDISLHCIIEEQFLQLPAHDL